MGSPLHGEAINIAQDEACARQPHCTHKVHCSHCSSLTQVIRMDDYIRALSRAMGVPYQPVVFASDAPHIGLPSALYGPLDTTKAARVLPGWAPTPMDSFLNTTVRWWAGPENKEDGHPRLPPDVLAAVQRQRAALGAARRADL